VAYLLKAAPLVEILVLQVYKLRLLIDWVKTARFGEKKILSPMMVYIIWVFFLGGGVLIPPLNSISFVQNLVVSRVWGKSRSRP